MKRECSLNLSFQIRQFSPKLDENITFNENRRKISRQTVSRRKKLMLAINSGIFNKYF